MSDEGADLLLQQDGGLLLLTINRPHAANAINARVSAGLVSGLREGELDPTVRAVVLTGTGDRAFSAGRDLKNPDSLDPKQLDRQRRTELRAYTDALLNFHKPLVVALNGVALGAGLMLALHADQIVAAETASISLPEIDIGIATFLGHALVAFRAGDGVASDMALTGRRLSAGEAMERGIVNKVASPVMCLDEAKATANSLGEKPAETYRAMKDWILTRRRLVVDAALNAHDAEFNGSGDGS